MSRMYGSIPPPDNEVRRAVSSTRAATRILTVALLASAVLVTLVAVARRPAPGMLMDTKLVLTPEQGVVHPLPPSIYQDVSLPSARFHAPSNGATYTPPTAEDGLAFKHKVHKTH